MSAFYTFAQKLCHSVGGFANGGIIGAIFHNLNISNSANMPLKNQVLTVVRANILNYLTSPMLLMWFFLGLFLTLFCVFLAIAMCWMQRRRPKLYRGLSRKFRRESEAPSILTWSTHLIVGLASLALLLFLHFAMLNAAVQSLASLRPLDETPLQNNYSQHFSQPYMGNSVSKILSYVLSDSRDLLENLVPSLTPKFRILAADMLDIIKTMQEKSSKKFNMELSEKIGTASVMKLNSEITNFLLTMFNSTSFLNGKLKDEYGRTYITFHKQLNEWTKFVKKNNLDEKFTWIRQLSELNFHKMAEIPRLAFDFASSFEYIMNQQNKTAETVMMEAERNQAKSQKKVTDTKKKVDEELNLPKLIDESFNNTLNSIKNKVDVYLVKIINLQERLPLLTRKYLRPVQVLFIVIFLISIVFLFTALIICYLVFFHKHCISTELVDSQRKCLKTFVYTAFGFHSFPFLVCCVLFIFTGLVENELCRFIRQPQIAASGSAAEIDEIQIESGELSSIDAQLDYFLLKNWPFNNSALMGSAPKQLISSFVSGCPNNLPLIEVLGLAHSINPAALSKPDISNKMMAVGKKWILHSLNSTDPDELFPKHVLDQIDKSSSLKNFVNDNFSSIIAEIEAFSPFYNKSGEVSDAEIKLLFLQITRDLKSSDFDSALSLIRNLSINYDSLVDLKLKAIYHLNAVYLLPPVANTSLQLKEAVLKLISNLKNKQFLNETASDLFTELVVNQSQKSGIETMSAFLPKMFKILLPCRQLYSIFSSSSQLVCSTFLPPLFGCWLFLGSVSLISGLILLFVLTLLIKQFPMNNLSAGEENNYIEMKIN